MATETRKSLHVPSYRLRPSAVTSRTRTSLAFRANHPARQGDCRPHELLQRLSDPFWFQAFGCVLGFDWHSGGVTTTSTGALKEGIRDIEHDLWVYALGGKAATSRKTPTEILDRCERLAVDPGPLLYASRMAANVASAACRMGTSSTTIRSFFPAPAFELRPRHPHTALLSAYERAPKDFEMLLGLQGVGTPFPLDHATCDRTIDTLHRAMAHAKGRSIR